MVEHPLSPAEHPLSLIAELTHRCPLHCVYCSNPKELQARESELDTATWKRVFGEAARLGILQLNLTGGEPTLRDDLVELIAHGRGAGLYSNLITSGVGVNEEKLRRYTEAGLDHIQLSIQDAEASPANEFAGTKAHLLKLRLAPLIKKFKLAFTMNMVIHRQNVDRLPAMIALAVELGADRLEIAHVQYYGWAFQNRAKLIPSREQIKRSLETISAAREKFKEQVRIEFATPDYFAKFPKPCMGGLGQRALVIDPAGRVMPCHAATVLPGMVFENVRERSLSEIWTSSEAFNRFRGDAWMKDPCRSCDRKGQDFGGCRCQAFLITGDERATDPVCSRSPERARIDEVLAAADGAPEKAWEYRR